MRQAIFVTTLGLAVAATALAATAGPALSPTQQQPSPMGSMGMSPMPSPMATSSGMSYYPQTPPSIGPSTGPTGVPSPMMPSPSPAAS
ncbi:MAG: hypothetical protein IAI50_12105 [Candidatus Eremiobacteraeota bacterium]|nr:hypothetical protein [Candidatus Eremiobacteraeota bacterium]